MQHVAATVALFLSAWQRAVYDPIPLPNAAQEVDARVAVALAAVLGVIVVSVWYLLVRRSRMSSRRPRSGSALP